jgi:hypothetical protein
VTVEMETPNREKRKFTLLSPVPHPQERLPGHQQPWTCSTVEEEIPDNEIRCLSSGIPYILIVPPENILKKFNVNYRVTLPVLKYVRKVIGDHLDALARRKVASAPPSAMRCKIMTSRKRMRSKESKVLLYNHN